MFGSAIDLQSSDVIVTTKNNTITINSSQPKNQSMSVLSYYENPSSKNNEKKLVNLNKKKVDLTSFSSLSTNHNDFFNSNNLNNTRLILPKLRNSSSFGESDLNGLRKDVNKNGLSPLPYLKITARKKIHAATLSDMTATSTNGSSTTLKQTYDNKLIGGSSSLTKFHSKFDD
jgi:hypothetical protein